MYRLLCEHIFTFSSIRPRITKWYADISSPLSGCMFLNASESVSSACHESLGSLTGKFIAWLGIEFCDGKALLVSYSSLYNLRFKIILIIETFVWKIFDSGELQHIWNRLKKMASLLFEASVKLGIVLYFYKSIEILTYWIVLILCCFYCFLPFFTTSISSLINLAYWPILLMFLKSALCFFYCFVVHV